MTTDTSNDKIVVDVFIWKVDPDILFKNNFVVGSGVAQLVERLLQIPEIRGLIPVIGKFYIVQLFTFNSVFIEKTKIKEKRGQERPIKI